MKIEIKKVIVGQNVTLTMDDSVNPLTKHTKRITDKEEKKAFVESIDSLKDSIEKAKSDKVRNKHIDTLISMFTSVTKEVEKEEEIKKTVVKAVKKQVEKEVKKESKKKDKEKLPTEMNLKELEELKKKNELEGKDLDEAINKLKGNENKVEAAVAKPEYRRRGEY